MNRSFLYSLVVTGFFLFSFNQAVYAKKQRPSSQVFKATYEAPTQIESLKPFATFNLKVKAKKLPTGETKLAYNLPADLTGVEQDISLVGNVLAPETLKGKDMQTICSQTSDQQLSCILKYDKLLGSFESTKQFLQEQNLTQDELEKKLQLAKIFNCGPIGVLRIENINVNSVLVVDNAFADKIEAVMATQAQCAD